MRLTLSTIISGSNARAIAAATAFLAFASACGSLRSFPEGESCVTVWGGTLESSSLYCRNSDEDPKTRKLSPESAFRNRMVCESIEYWTDTREWKRDVEHELARKYQ